MDIKVGGTAIGEIVPPDVGHRALIAPAWGIGPWTIGHGAPDMAKPAVASDQSCRTAPTLEDLALQKL
ncbi:hypothetical protein [Kamptonema formosum]|uniref:hypothetical protein n=1 Tax=Kamptonema formosum TaxID=331992 RepID=UPI0012DD16E2|nr:hypothetical protein [Oscillatoria sp. PCC 10802]